MPAFDHEFFDHVIETRLFEGQDIPRTFKVMSSVLRRPIVSFIFDILESAITVLMNLKIPVYSGFVRILVTFWPGLPTMSGCYLRALYYRGQLKSMGRNVLIEQGAIISNPSGVELSDFSFIDRYVMLAAKTARIGRRVHIAPYSIITGGGHFEIADYGGIANSASIITSSETMKDGTRACGPMVPPGQNDPIRGFVRIEKDGFIGTKAVVFPNVTIREGSIVGAGAMILKDTEPWSVYVPSGGKAHILRQRKPLDLPDL